MAEWMSTALDVFDGAGVRNDPHFEGIGVYGWTTTDGGGFSPVTPPEAALNVMKKRGYLPYATPPAAFPKAGEGTGNKNVQNEKDVSDSGGKGKNNLNKCKSKHLKSCPPHYMVGSPMNYEI